VSEGGGPANPRAGRDYLLSVKRNQPNLQAAVKQVFADACATDFAGTTFTQHVTVDDGHGRHEEWYVTVIPDPKGLPAEWTDANALVHVNRERETEGKNVTTTLYYVTSHRGTAEEMAGLVRGHWGIENGLHWVLDVVFGEDDSRVRAGHAGAHLAMIRKAAVALLRRAPGKGSGVTKRLKVGWDDDYLFQVLQGIQTKVVR
jgi:predicted transposase YbfD/YdcC